MDTPVSLSDIAAVTRGSDDANGFGGGWFLIVILFLFMFGFGGNGWNKQGELGQYATAATQQEILFGQQFAQINERLTNLGNGVCSLGYDIQGNMGTLGKEIALSQAGTNANIMQSANAIQQQISAASCSINANIDAKFAALEKSQLEQRIAEQAARIASLEMDNRLYGVVRYPNGYTYNAGNSPFCGGCCNGSM